MRALRIEDFVAAERAPPRREGDPRRVELDGTALIFCCVGRAAMLLPRAARRALVFVAAL